MTDQSSRFLWIDLETTGLDPITGVVLEYAAVITDDDLNTIELHSGVIHHDRDTLEALEISGYVREMHTNSNLWRDVEASSLTQIGADVQLEQVAYTLSRGTEGLPLCLAGSSVHFDLAWCQVHFPRLSALLSYRVLDVRSLQLAVDAWCTRAVSWPDRTGHRAIPDILDTLAEARMIRRLLSARGAS